MPLMNRFIRNLSLVTVGVSPFTYGVFFYRVKPQWFSTLACDHNNGEEVVNIKIAKSIDGKISYTMTLGDEGRFHPLIQIVKPSEKELVVKVFIKDDIIKNDKPINNDAPLPKLEKSGNLLKTGDPDLFLEWLNTCTERGANFGAYVSKLHPSYKVFMMQKGFFPVGKKTFVKVLLEKSASHSFKLIKIRKTIGIFIKGLRIS